MPSRVFNATSPPDVPLMVPALVPVDAFVGVLVVVAGGWLQAATSIPAAAAIPSAVRFIILPPRD